MVTSLVRTPLSRSLAVFLSLGLGSPLRAQAPPPQRVRVTAALANVRSEPSLKGALVSGVKKGDELVLLDEASGWYHVQSAAGWQGYLRKDLAEPLEAPPPPPPPPAPAAAAPTASPAAEGTAIQHKPLACILAESFPKVDARFEAADLARARVYFRANGTLHWYYVEMTQEGAAYQGILPKPLKTTTKVDYYLEGLEKSTTSGRTQEYNPIVVPRTADCGSKMMAATVPTAKLAVGTTAVGDPPVPQGFDPAGIIAAGAAAAAAATTTASSSSHTLLFVAGGVVAAGGIALAAKGGGGSTSTASVSVSLSGSWTGTFTGNESGSSHGITVTCQWTDNVSIQITQSGSAISGSGTNTSSSAQCNVPLVAPVHAFGSSGGGSFTGTANGGQFTMSIPPLTITGTYTSNSINGTWSQTQNLNGITVTANGALNLTR